MSALFPLPQPKPARFVKKGLFAAEPGTATAAARSSSTVVAPYLPRPHSTITEGEVTAGKLATDDDGKPPNTGGGAGGGGASRAISASDGGGSTSSDPPPQAAESEAGAKAGAGGDNTDSNNSDKSATTASESSSTTQYAMTAAARTKAYKGIFRTGGGDKPKKRPRSPVASTPLHLPFPRPPAGVSLATADLEEQPPCGSEEYVQTEAGSEWAWGLLGDKQDGGGDGDVASGSGGVGGASAGAGGESGGPRHRDFRLPYDVIYDCHYQRF
ncbi:unnamed protein product, partial [Ectocarpus sp. 12 AP-2014]